MKTTISSIAFLLLISLTTWSCQKEEAISPTVTSLDQYTISALSNKTYTQVVEDLACIETIKELFISSDWVLNLSFLENLKEIGSLTLNECPNLVDLNSLAKVKVSDLFISHCPSIQLISNFDFTVDLQTLFIDSCINLVNVEFPELNTVGKTVFIQNSPKLELFSLPKLQSVEENFVITNCALLTILDCSALETVGEDFLLDQNERLVTLDGFSALNEVNGDKLFINNNAMLSDLTGLSGLTKVNEIFIKNNNIADFCPLKELIINNPDLYFEMERKENGQTTQLDRDYFLACE
ncbi:MAG: hypothetical protein AB8G15_13030 [Saprospiraceae bacterium]